MTFQDQSSTNLPKINVLAALTICNDANVLIPALEQLSFSYGFFLTPGKFHQEQNSRHQLTCIKAQLEEGHNRLKGLAKKYPEKIDFALIEKKLQAATEKGLLSWGEYSERIKEVQRKELEAELRNQSTLKTIWKNALLACGHTVEAADNLFIGGAKTLAGSITSFKNPLEVASDIGAKHILDNQKYYNILWGSVYGTENDFAKMDLYQAMMSSNYVAHFGSAVISPLIETTNLSYDFYCMKVIGGDLSYQEFKKIQQKDECLRWGKNAFHIAEIALSLAAIGKIHGATSLKDLTAPLKVGSIFGSVGALGNELCADDGMSFGRFIDGFLEQMAGSLFCNFILSAAAGKQASAIDFIDAQNDFKESSVEFVKEILKHNWTWQTVSELEWKDSKKLLGRALLTGLSTFDAFDHNSATPKTKVQNGGGGLNYENVELNGIKGQIRISKNNKAVFVKNSPELFQEIIRLDLEERLKEEGRFSTEQIRILALEKAKAANSYTDRFGRIITQAIDIRNDSRETRIAKASVMHHEHQHLLQLDLPLANPVDKEFRAYSKQDDFVQKATDGEKVLDFSTGNVVSASTRRESRDQLITRHLEHTLVGNTFLALSERNSAVAEFLQEVGEYILAIKEGKTKELREAKRKTHSKEISEAVVKHFWSQGQLGFAEQAFKIFHLTFADIKSSDLFKRFSRLLDHKNNLLQSSLAFLKNNCQIEGENLAAVIELAKQYRVENEELRKQIGFAIIAITDIDLLFVQNQQRDIHALTQHLRTRIIAKPEIICGGLVNEQKYVEICNLILYSVYEINSSTKPEIYSPEYYDSFWTWTAIFGSFGGEYAFNELLEELKRVGNEEFLPDCADDNQNFHWSAAYQEILLEALFLSPARDEGLQNKKREILEQALTLKSEKLRTLAQFYLDLNYFAGLEHGFQESEILFSYIKNRARNITKQYRTSSVADYTEFARVDKVREYGKHFCILALKGAIDNHTQLNLEVLGRCCESKTEFEEIIIREIKQAWLEGRIEDILVFEENHLLFFDHPLLSKLRRLKERILTEACSMKSPHGAKLAQYYLATNNFSGEEHFSDRHLILQLYVGDRFSHEGDYTNGVFVDKIKLVQNASRGKAALITEIINQAANSFILGLQLAPQAANLEQALVVLSHIPKKCKELENEIDRGEVPLINNVTQQLLMLLNSNPDCFLSASEYILTDSLQILSQQILKLVKKYPKLLQAIKPVSVIEEFRRQFGISSGKELGPKVARGLSSSEIAIPEDDVSLEIPEKQMVGVAVGDEAAIQSFLRKMPVCEAKIPIITNDGGIVFIPIIDYLKYLEKNSSHAITVSRFYQTQKLEKIVETKTANQIDVTFDLNPSADEFSIFPLTPFSKVVGYTAKGKRTIEIRRTPWGTTEVRYEGKASSVTLRIELTDQPFEHPYYQRFRKILVQATENFTLPLDQLDPDLQSIVEQARVDLDKNFDVALRLLIAADGENNLYTTSARIRLGYKLHGKNALFLALGLGIGNCDDLSRKRAALLSAASIPCLIYNGLIPMSDTGFCGIYTPGHAQVAVFGSKEIVISDPTVRTKSVDPKNKSIEFAEGNLPMRPPAIFKLGRDIRKALDDDGLRESSLSGNLSHQFNDGLNGDGVIKYLALCVNHIHNISNVNDERKFRRAISSNVQLLELMFDNGKYEREAWYLHFHGPYIRTIVEFLYQAEKYLKHPVLIRKTQTTLTKYLSLIPELINIKHFNSVISSDKDNVCFPKVLNELNKRITTDVKDLREKIRYRIEILKAIKEAFDLPANQIRISESLLITLYFISKELGNDVVISNETELINAIKQSLRALRDFTPHAVDKKLLLIAWFLQGFSKCSNEVQDRLLEEADFGNCFKRELDGSLSLPAAFQEQLFSLLYEDYCTNKRFRYVSLFSEVSFFKLTGEQKKRLSTEVAKNRAQHHFFLNRPDSDHSISSLLFYLMAKAPLGMQSTDFISIVSLYNQGFLDDSIFVTEEETEENLSYRREEDLACEYFSLASSNQNKRQMLKMGDFNCNFQVEFFAQLLLFYCETNSGNDEEGIRPLINLAKLQGTNQTICSLFESFAELYPNFFDAYMTEVYIWLTDVMGIDLLKEILLEYYLRQLEENKIKYSLYCFIQANVFFITGGFVKTDKFDSLVTNDEILFFQSVDPGYARDGTRNGVVFSHELQDRIRKSQFPNREYEYSPFKDYGYSLGNLFYIRLAGFIPVNKDEQGKTVSANHPGDTGHVEARVIFPILDRRFETAAKKLDEEHQRINRNANLTPVEALRLIGNRSFDGIALNIRGVVPNENTYELRSFAPDVDRRLLTRIPDHRLSPPQKKVIQKETASTSTDVPAVISVGNVDNGLVEYSGIPTGAVLPIPTLVRVPPVISAGNVNNILVLDAEYLPEQEGSAFNDKVFVNLERIYLLLLSYVNEARTHSRDPLKYLPELHIYARGICLQKFDKQFFQQLMTSTEMSKKLLMHLWSIGIFWQYFLEEEGRCQDQMIFPEFPLLESGELVGSLDRQLKYRIMLFISKKHRTKTRQGLAGKIDKISLQYPD